MRNSFLLIVFLCYAIVISACSEGSSFGQKTQPEKIPEGLFSINLERYPVKVLDVNFDREITEDQLGNFKSVMTKRLSSLLARERISKAYDRLAEKINKRYQGDLKVTRKPEGIKIQLIAAGKNLKQQELIDKFFEVKDEILDSYPTLAESVFDTAKIADKRKLSRGLVLSFSRKVLSKLADQTIQQYGDFFKKQISNNNKSQLQIDVPILSSNDRYLDKYLGDLGVFSIAEVNEGSGVKPGQEVLILKISDRIKNRVPPQKLNVVEIKELNDLIASTTIAHDSRFDEWYVVPKLTDEGARFLEDVTSRLMTRRVAFVLDRGTSGKEILSAQVVRERVKSGIIRLPLNTHLEAQNLRDILFSGPYMKPPINSSLSAI